MAGQDKACKINFPRTCRRIDTSIDSDDYNIVVGDDELIWRCNCGHLLFFLTQDGAKCRRCGVISKGWCD